jgi:hypothetical protein
MSHPLTTGRRLWTESSPRVVVRRCATVACRSTPLLRSPQCRGQALATKGPVQRSLMVPVRVHRLGRRLAPPPFAAWCMPFHCVAPRRSLHLQCGMDSRLAPKCTALRRVLAAAATAATVLEPPRSLARACTPPLCHALH